MMKSVKMNKKMLKYACTAVYEDILELTNSKIYDPKIVEDNVKWLKEQSGKYDIDISFDLERINYAIDELLNTLEMNKNDSEIS